MRIWMQRGAVVSLINTGETDMTNSHLDALNLRLSNERVRLANAKTDSERTLRTVWIKQIEKEIRNEEGFVTTQDISDEQLLRELTA